MRSATMETSSQQIKVTIKKTGDTTYRIVTFEPNQYVHDSDDCEKKSNCQLLKWINRKNEVSDD